jgi:hypothetical protein
MRSPVGAFLVIAPSSAGRRLTLRPPRSAHAAQARSNRARDSGRGATWFTPRCGLEVDTRVMAMALAERLGLSSGDADYWALLDPWRAGR